jgi:hypothetical protein
MHRRRLTGVVYEVYRRRGHWASWIQLTLNRMGSDVRREVRTVRMNVMLGYSKPQRPPACDVTIPSTSPRGGRSGTVRCNDDAFSEVRMDRLVHPHHAHHPQRPVRLRGLL